MSKVVILTADTDVVVIVLGVFDRLLSLNPDLNLWIDFGCGNHKQIISVNDAFIRLGPTRCRALPMFHAITGCDTVSCFFGKGKRTCWQAMQHCPRVVSAFSAPAREYSDINSPVFSAIEEFVIRIYDKYSIEESINTARKNLFRKSTKRMETLPPTRDALFQHTKRAVQQAHLWRSCLSTEIQSLDPQEFGWMWSGSSWTPKWTTLPEASVACKTLIRCGCKSRCGTKACKCTKAGYPCCGLCQCGGLCGNICS